MAIKETGRDQQARFRPQGSGLALDHDLISARQGQEMFPPCVIHDDFGQKPPAAFQKRPWIKIHERQGVTRAHDTHPPACQRYEGLGSVSGRADLTGSRLLGSTGLPAFRLGRVSSLEGACARARLSKVVFGQTTHGGQRSGEMVAVRDVGRGRARLDLQLGQNAGHMDLDGAHTHREFIGNVVV